MAKALTSLGEFDQGIETLWAHRSDSLKKEKKRFSRRPEIKTENEIMVQKDPL